MNWINLILMAGVGVLAGLYGSILGLGGGVLLVPILTLFFKIPIHSAIGTSLLCVIATSSTAATSYVQNKLADVRLGMTLELATTLGAICGGIIAGFFHGNVLSVIFSFILLYSAISMLSKKENENKDMQLSSNGTMRNAPTGTSYQVKNLPAGLGLSFLAGNFSGLLGIGGGVIKVPAMYLFMGIPLKIATATSNFMIGVTACAGAFIYYFRGDIDILISGISILGIFLGARIGSRIIYKIKTEYIRIAFIIILFYLFLEMFFKGIKVTFLIFG
ncbi:MAG: sulfite exporter TauE/SafE family protein [candidate division Zixibacteria bacterium]|nr:sulfite exporter TauE/SafE family protein [candidate division Zixibacteria bacterium]